MSNIGERIKRYEKAYDFKLTPRSCLFIRVDGKSFHTFTRHCAKPFDSALMDAMEGAARSTADEMAGFKLGYIQSDEATFMLTDFDRHETQGWFGYELNKVVSISASLFTAHFNQRYTHPNGVPAVFDSRAFIVPIDDAPNVFVWRQRDWERNSIQMLARAHFSHKQCENKKMAELHEMLHTSGVNWAKLTPREKNGTYLTPEASIYAKLDYETIATGLRFDDPIGASA